MHDRQEARSIRYQRGLIQCCSGVGRGCGDDGGGKDGIGCCGDLGGD